MESLANQSNTLKKDPSSTRQQPRQKFLFNDQVLSNMREQVKVDKEIQTNDLELVDNDLDEFEGDCKDNQP